MTKKATPPEDVRVAESGAWEGTEPANGTRRGLIRNAVFDLIRNWQIRYKPDEDPAATSNAALAIADATELALLKSAETTTETPQVEGAESWQFEFPEVNDPEVDGSTWRWRLIAGGGDIAAQSVDYATKAEAEEGAETFKAHAARAGFPLAS